MSSSANRRALRAKARGPEAPVVLDPRAGRPRLFSTAEAPIGEIRLRRDGKGLRRARFIKVATSGTPAQRWRPYSRWLWEQHNGPVPDGKLVIHLDGDRLNDDLANLALGTSDDALFIAHQRGCPTHTPLQRQRTRESNVIRGRLRRLAGPLACAWYLVDVERRRIWNTADHTRWDALRRVGIEAAGKSGANGAGVTAACLGWPRRSSMGAALLTALAEAGCLLTTPEARRRAAIVLGRYGHAAPTTSGAWASASTVLVRDGLVARKRRGRHESLVSITQAALEERGASTRLLAVHAEDLGRFQGFTWATERGQDYQRGVLVEPIAALAEACEGVAS